ncbi:MAG: ATP-dependent DNA helicase [Bacteroidetes bacterium RIFCSPLOWO2_12_FULL_35_15]|nr:MAG: ATP-dependent DNA helicase [Bacteroidetes bacterium RIFCSPLOWO2_12_FULL_35_15]
MSKNYLDELNTVQRKAVECIEGPVMIIAGAGSGKTRVLTYRIAHLMQKGVDPFNILALTFTNKAAREMKERIAKIVGESESKNLWMGTFHSVFARILRSEAEKLGYPGNFTIYDTDDSKSLIRTILKEQGLDDKVYKVGMVLSRISAAKNNLISAQAYLVNAQIQEEDRQALKPKMGIIYQIYANRCFKAGAMDFDDLLFNTNILLRDHPKALHKYQHKFKYILVDEYQDTNFSQYVIVKQLAAAFRNIAVVGDDAQSIYSFRGANIQNILNFEKDYPELFTFKLEQNYRSTQTIVGAANSVISKNKEQIKKTVFTENAEGEKIKVVKSDTDNAEGNFVANSIFETKMNEQAQNRDFAILYRTNAQSRAMEEGLRRQNIPYRIYGGLSFYHRKEIRDLLAYYRLAINNHDEEALKRVINYPMRGIGDTTIDKIIVGANDHNISLWKVIENINEFEIGLNAGAKAKVDEFASMIKSFSAMLKTHNAYDLGQYIAVHSRVLQDLYADKSPEGVSRHENIQALLNGLKEFTESEIVVNDIGIEDLESQEESQEPGEENQESKSENQESSSKDQNFENQIMFASEEKEIGNQRPEIEKEKRLDIFMQDIALLTDADKENQTEEDKNRVLLMTIHAAKGLEFKYVYIVGLEENLFPSQMALTDRSDLEEERRLFYVAITRAEKCVTLSYSATRFRWGNLIYCEPSRFIEELDSKYVELPMENNQRLFANEEYTRKSTSYSAKPKETFVQRPVFGKKLVKVNSAAKTTSDFDTESLRNLQVGMDVEHDRFGSGKVISMEGAFPNNKATVFFEGIGQKQLLIKFAKLRIVE